jgi:ribosomal protein S7
MNPKIQSTFIIKKLTSLLMYSGKKKLVFKKVMQSLQALSANSLKDSSSRTHDSRGEQRAVIKNICILTTVFHKFKPFLETRKVRKASKYYEVPFFLKKARALSILLRWVVNSIRKQGSLKNIQAEFLEMIHETGNTVKEAKALRTKVANNIMFSHYRWR